MGPLHRGLNTELTEGRTRSEKAQKWNSGNYTGFLQSPALTVTKSPEVPGKANTALHQILITGCVGSGLMCLAVLAALCVCISDLFLS